MDETASTLSLNKRIALLRDFLMFALSHPRAALDWITTHHLPHTAYPDIQSTQEWQEFRKNLLPVVQEYFDAKWAQDRPAKSTLVPCRSNKTYTTDILYTGTLKADAHKDLLALRQARPNAHITVLYLWPVLSLSRSFVFDLADRVFFIRTQAEFCEFLFNSTAKALVFQGGDDQFPLLNCCMYPGRLVWQVRDTILRTPKELVESLWYERARCIAERADAITSFHSEEGWKEVTKRDGVRFRSSPVSIPPFCVPVLGPKKRLPKLSSHDNETHIIFAGGVGQRGGNTFGTITYTHADFYEKFRTITEQGIHVHVYSPHTDTPRKGFEQYFALQKESRFFHIEHSLPFQELLMEYTKYDWALVHVTWQPEYLIPGFDRPIQNGITGPLQAQVPLIVSPTALGNAELVERVRRGIVVDEKDMGKLREILESYATLPSENETRSLEPELLYNAEAFAHAVLGT